MKFLFLFFISLPLLAQAERAVEFSTKSIKVGKETLKVWIADSDEKRTQGMMFKTSWPKEVGGMLFIFKDENKRSFWMKNTFLPLSLGFFDSKGVLLETATMDPPKSLAQLKIDRVLSLKPAKYVLEVPKGWFKNEGVEAGSKLRPL